MTNYKAKPLGRKLYGSIGHLPNSRLGPGDHRVPAGQAKICTQQLRDSKDRVIIQEKLDGSCCGVTKLEGEIVPLVRAGYRAATSPYKFHRLFHDWVFDNWDFFFSLLEESERVVGEWLALAHGTIYDLPCSPFAVFDIITRDNKRIIHEELNARIASISPSTTVSIPYTVKNHYKPMSVKEALTEVQQVNKHGAEDPVEGLVYRVERDGEVDFLAKYVRHDKVDGCYLPEKSGDAPIWLWKPED